MRKRVGELLVERELITPLELDQALKAQLIFGGHLGTCLIELDFIDERSFGQALAELHGLRYAGPGNLRGVPPEVTGRFSWNLAEKHKAVPIALEDNTLVVAVVDPRNLGRLSTLTGCKIVPRIAPEFRVYEALEAYYGIQRSPRYVRLCEKLSRGTVRREKAAVESPAATNLDPAHGGSAAATATDLGVEFGYGKSWRDVADELFRFDEPGDHDVQPDPRGAGPRTEPAGAPATSVFQRMSRAESKDELARAVLDHATAHMARALLFSVRSETAAPWDWAGVDLPRQRVYGLRFPVTGGSIFSLMLGDDGVYRGPVPDQPHCRWIYAALQIDAPQEVLLLPVYLNDRLAAIFYGDGGPQGRIRGETESFVNLARRLGLALSMLVLKMKIRSES